ncbi:MAG: glycine-rich domain-containing protein [Massilia sp.]
MNTQNVMKAIAALDLEPVKTKLMHVASGEGWSRAQVNAIDIEYRRFLYLMHAFPNDEAAPSVAVDTFWHYHILDTAKYARDCEATFGYFLHHYPYLGLEGEDGAQAHERGGERMRELYEQTFGEPYGAAQNDVQAAFCMLRPGQQAGAFCMVRPGEAAGATEAAFCMVRPGQVDQAIRPTTIGPGVRAAFCMLRPGHKPQAANDAAFCMVRTESNHELTSTTAFCMCRPGQPQAAQQEVNQAA